MATAEIQSMNNSLVLVRKVAKRNSLKLVEAMRRRHWTLSEFITRPDNTLELFFRK